MISNRKLVSFDGHCPVNCKHCYTHDFVYETEINPDYGQINDLVSSLDDGKDFDVIYVSRRRENFIDESAGIELIKQLYRKYKKHILVITRMNLTKTCIDQLAQINCAMMTEGKRLVVAISIAADSSYNTIEDSQHIASPRDRCEALKKTHEAGIQTILMARPILPNSIIPTREIIELIIEYKQSIDVVVSSGLAVNHRILSRLNKTEKDFIYLPGDNTEFLIGSEAKGIRYVDVSKELASIKESCIKIKIPFYTHSIQALNQLIQ